MNAGKLFLTSIAIAFAVAPAALGGQTHELAVAVEQGLAFTNVKGGSFTVGSMMYAGAGGGLEWSTYPGTGVSIQYAFDWLEDDRTTLSSGRRINIGAVAEGAYIYSPEASFFRFGGGLDVSIWRIKTQITAGYGKFLGLIQPDDEAKPGFSPDGLCLGVSIGYEHPLKGLSLGWAQGFLFVGINSEACLGERAGERTALRAGLRFVFPDRWTEEEYRADIASG